MAVPLIWRFIGRNAVRAWRACTDNRKFALFPTKDNAPVAIDFLPYHKVFNASESVIQAQDFKGEGVEIANTTLRAVVGDMPLDKLLARRDY